MTALVVDSAVAIKWFVVEPHFAEARRILDDYSVGTISLLAPELIYAEFGNVLWKKCAFQGMTAEDAQGILGAFRKLEFEITPTSDLVDDAFVLAVRHRRTVYDMLFVALSLRHGCQCVTADEKLFNAVHGAVPNLVSLAGGWHQ